jgi:hypothetical protein
MRTTSRRSRPLAGAAASHRYPDPRLRRCIGVSSGSVVSLYAVGASLLAFWLVVRYPAVGPQSIQSAMFVVVAVFLVQSPVMLLVGPVQLAAGAPVALLAVVLPSLVTLFWSAGCLVRNLATLISPYR